MIHEFADGYFVRSLRESDLNGPYQSWFEDQEVCKYNSHGKFFKNSSYFRNFLDGLNSENQVVWAICHAADGHIGNISLQNISFVNRHAEFSILLGDKRHWHKGIAFMAGQALVRHGFYKLNLERIHCGTAATNHGMIKLALALGMREEGRRIAHLYLESEWIDVIEYGLLRRDYQLGMPRA